MVVAATVLVAAKSVAAKSVDATVVVDATALEIGTGAKVSLAWHECSSYTRTASWIILNRKTT